MLQNEAFTLDGEYYAGWDGETYQSLPGEYVRLHALLSNRAGSEDAWQQLTGTELEAFYDTFTGGAALDVCVPTTLEQIQALQPDFR